MRIEVPIPPDVEAALRRHSAEAGLSVETLVARLLERYVRKIPDLVEISGPIGEAFKASGMSEDELSELLEREKHAMRAERRSKSES